jgi:prophage regulatory protein
MTTHFQLGPRSDFTTSDRILRWPEVQSRVGYCRSHIHNLVSKGDFPSPVKLGARASGWIESEVDSWIASRIEISRNGGEL